MRSKPSAQRGLPPERAIYEACLARFRPILMTTLAALLGAVPLVIATGPGSELRRPLGITIIGGLLVSQMLTLYTTPVIYLLLDRLHRRLGGRGPLTAGNETSAGRVAQMRVRCHSGAGRRPEPGVHNPGGSRSCSQRKSL